ncbi:MAG TPA: phosphopantothenoylcysteine decarboxylase [Prolixibacteraceae bacterium]|jgi:phosphopantothenoylcysteine decarboxylase/phosphopantothenate--cysteine ligase
MDQPIFYKKKVLITAGPTREAIDPVRYISNHSSGKMGYAIAKSFLDEGANVILVSGPVNLQLSHKNLTIIPVTSASEMHSASNSCFDEIDIAVFAAAVADYRPATVTNCKLKKDGEELLLRLIKNPDIAFEFGLTKKANQLSIGFALETHNEIVYALEKLYRKNFDFIVLNSLNDKGAAFGQDTNKVTILNRDLEIRSFDVKIKAEVAIDILNEISVLQTQRKLNH